MLNHARPWNVFRSQNVYVPLRVDGDGGKCKLHYQSHVDSRYKRSLRKTMLDCAKRLSSTQDFLLQECKNLKGMFLKLKYPEKLIDSAINRLHHPTDPAQTPANSPVRITLPFKDQKSADVVRRRLGDLGTKINQQRQPVFTSKKIADHLRVTEEKPPLINQQSVVYEFTCDLCDTNYIAVHLPPSPSTHRGT